MPPPQDPTPENNILEDDMPFDFIGLGQPANGIVQASWWEPWPDEEDELNQEADSAEVGAELQKCRLRYHKRNSSSLSYNQRDLKGKLLCLKTM